VPWYRFGAIWSEWGQGASPESWKAAFKFMDKDGDGEISNGEFNKGYKLGGPSGGFSPNPLWLIGLVVLLAAIALCVRAFALEKVQLPYQLLAKAETDKSKTAPLASPDRWTQVHGTAAPAPKAEPKKAPEAKPKAAPAPAGNWFQTRSLRSCDSGMGAMGTSLGKIGLLDCGWRKDAAKDAKEAPKEPPKPVCEKCGVKCKCIGRSLPAVLAWRGPEAQEDEVVVLLRNMRADPLNSEKQESIMLRLEELSLVAESKAKITKLGGIDAFVEAMYNHPGNPGLQENGCGLLGNMALRSEENQKAIGLAGGVDAVLRAMAEHASNDIVQEKGCWALQQFAMVSKNRMEITSRSGVERIVQAMQAHIGCEALQEQACMALGNLAFELETRRWIAHDGGVDAIVAAMKAFPKAAVLQENACFAIHNMACSDEAMRVIFERGGLQAVVEAMKEHPRAPGVQENAINALHNVNCGPLSYVHKVAKLGGIELVIAAMKGTTTASLQAKACHVLGQLGDRDKDVRRHIEKAGGIEAIANAKAKFQQSKEVQTAANDAMQFIYD